MEISNGARSTLLDKLRKAVDDNLTNDQFSVEDLARSIGMSRSQLHRKLNIATGQSVSQFIREHRLQLGMQLLKQGELTAAEVADRVGFGSATYFSKCFTDFYGFPPGEVKNRVLEADDFGIANPPANNIVHPKTPARRRTIGLIILSAIIVAAALYFLYDGKEGHTATAADKSIAILPFKNIGGDQDDRYFTDGVIEAIFTRLSQIRELRVISRTSVEQYRRTDKPAGEIARELGVAALLEGSIQRNDNRVRVDVRMVNGVTEALVWAKTFDHELKDVFAIQREIAQHVAGALQAELSPEERLQLEKSETHNPEAYDLYLKAVYEYRTYTNLGVHNSIRLLTKAISLDSGYARAHAFLANSYIGLATIFGAELSAIEALEKGKPFIDKALALDPDLDEAHMLMGFYRLYHDWDFEAAEREYLQAIESDHPDALALYVDFLNFMLRHKEALAIAERLNEKDPYYPNSRMVLSYIFNKRFDEALEFSNSRLKLFKNYLTLDSHGFLLLNVGRYAEAIEFFDRAIALEGIRYPRMLGWMGAAYALSGDRGKASAIIAELKERVENKEKTSIAFFIAVIYSAMDEREQALAWLRTAYESHDMEMPWLLTEPQFNKLHKEAEFQELASQMGFN